MPSSLITHFISQVTPCAGKMLWGETLLQWGLFLIGLLKRKDAFSQRAREHGLPSPRGLLIVGIPGTGKSLTAKVTANVFGRPLLKLDAGRLYGSPSRLPGCVSWRSDAAGWQRQSRRLLAEGRSRHSAGTRGSLQLSGARHISRQWGRGRMLG